MAAANDILINGERDINIVDGDIEVGLSDPQHIEHLLFSRPGQFSQFPTVGASTQDLILSNIHKATERRKIRTTLVDDNYRVNKIDITGEGDKTIIEIDAIRKR